MKLTIVVDVTDVDIVLLEAVEVADMVLNDDDVTLQTWVDEVHPEARLGDDLSFALLSAEWTP